MDSSFEPLSLRADDGAIRPDMGLSLSLFIQLCSDIDIDIDIDIIVALFAGISCWLLRAFCTLVAP